MEFDLIGEHEFEIGSGSTLESTPKCGVLFPNPISSTTIFHYQRQDIWSKGKKGCQELKKSVGYKSSLVSKNYNHILGIDFTHVFFPILNHSSI